jgi:HEAT repeat protein
MYRGPGGVVPSPTSPSGPSTSPDAGGGGATGGGGVRSGGTTGNSPAPSQPGANLGGPAGPGTAGVQIGDDLTRWNYWWEFHKDPFLRLKGAVHGSDVVAYSDAYFLGAEPRDGVDSMRPTRAELLARVVPALHRTLAATDQRDITSSCLIALAKTGLDHPDHPLLPALRARLQSRDQEIRETAALALGIAQSADAVDDLIGLVRDLPRGRTLTQRSEVDDRTRAFAAYGLGLVAHTSTALKVKHAAFVALSEVAADTKLPSLDLRVAAVDAIGLLRPERAADGGDALRAACLACLQRLRQTPAGAGHQLVHAHVAPAAANLLEGAPEAERAEVVRALVRELRSDESEQRRNQALVQSAAIALGRLASADDAEASAALEETYRESADAQTGYFALVALAEIGGRKNRDRLLGALESGKKALEKPWAALALGVLEQRRLGRREAPDGEIGAALLREIDAIKNPESVAALAVALGLARHEAAAPRLRELLERYRAHDELAGYLCIALALLDDEAAIEPIRAVVESAGRRPRLLLQGAIALGRLGDKRAADQLVDRMGAEGQNLVTLGSLAYAVGQIGDRRSIDRLVAMLDDESASDLARAFAAVALGGVADKEAEPWNAKIARSVNYRAATDALTNQVSGILDIL